MTKCDVCCSIGDSFKKGVSKVQNGMGALLAGDDATKGDTAAASAAASTAATAAAAAAAATAAAAANLPAGWEVLLDDRGVVFYGNPELRITQYTHLTPNITTNFLH